MYGIYKIVNKINNKVYIGQSKDVERRKSCHIRDLRLNRHRNKHLQSSFNKYGEENFEFIIIEHYDKCDVDFLTRREQYWIDFYGGLNSDKNYNKRDAGSLGTHSIETRKKISQLHKGKPVVITEETKRKISKSLKGRPAHNKGKPVSEETKKKLSETLKGRQPHEWTDISKKRLSESLKGRTAWNKGRNMPYKGIKKTEEEKIRLRQLHSSRGYKVQQFDLSGNLLNEYITTMEAQRQTGIKNSNIGACCRGLQPTAGGFIWKKVR